VEQNLRTESLSAKEAGKQAGKPARFHKLLFGPVGLKGGETQEESGMLLFSNLPHNCSEGELRSSIESRGLKLHSVRIISDTISRSSPAFGQVELDSESSAARAVVSLKGMLIRNRVVQVRQTAELRPTKEVTLAARKQVSKHVAREVPR
jgi:RNA recognition motif-containing protein